MNIATLLCSPYKAITGDTFGDNSEAWQRWYEERIPVYGDGRNKVFGRSTPIFHNVQCKENDEDDSG